MRRSLTPIVLLTAIVLLMLAAVPAAHASKVKVWHHHQTSHYDRARFKGAVVSSEGALRLSRQVKLLANLEALHVWALVEDPIGNLFAATGEEGKLFKIAPDGKVSVAYSGSQSQILSLAVGADGTVFAGTGPAGQVVAVTPQGNATVIADDLDQYVWSLVFDPPTKTLFAGTGPKGKIYRITAEGKVSVFYATRQDHVLCLARDAKSMLYAGTDKGGLIYRIDPSGKGFVLHHANQDEVRSLLASADGIYAGTSAPARKRPASGSNTEGGENAIYRIAPDGTVRELFREKVMMLSLLRREGRILVGTGMQGQLFEIDEASKERIELARLDHNQIHCLLERRDGSIVLGTGDPGKLYVLDDKLASQGTVLSDVLDAKIVSKWGAMTWKAQTPPGTRITVAVRTGNVAEPDVTWSDWSAEQTDPAAARIRAPAARFLQYRVTLTSDDPKVTPELRNLSLRYATTNQAPEITSFDVPDLDAVNLDNPKQLKLKWSATDPNDDELTYSLHVRKDSWKDWVLLDEDLEKKTYDWDTTGFPTGMYQVKLVASDRRDNPEGEALTGARISAPVPVSHTPPTVTVKLAGMEGDRALFEATATDPIVRLSEASFTVNGKRPASVFPTDGLFDSNSEAFHFKTESLRPGAYVLVLRVRNAAGNVGSADVVFNVREKK